MAIRWMGGIKEAVAVVAGVGVGAYVAPYIGDIPGGVWAQVLIGFALAWFGAAWDGLIGDVVMGVGAGIVVMALPSLIVKAKKAAA